MRSKAAMVPMLCQLGAPSSTCMSLNQKQIKHKALLVTMLYKLGAPKSKRMSLDYSSHLGSPRPYCCRCFANKVPHQHRV